MVKQDVGRTDPHAYLPLVSVVDVLRVDFVTEQPSVETLDESEVFTHDATDLLGGQFEIPKSIDGVAGDVGVSSEERKRLFSGECAPILEQYSFLPDLIYTFVFNTKDAFSFINRKERTVDLDQLHLGAIVKRFLQWRRVKAIELSSVVASEKSASSSIEEAQDDDESELIVFEAVCYTESHDVLFSF